MTAKTAAGSGAKPEGQTKGGGARVIVLALAVVLLAIGILLVFAGPTLYRMGVLGLDAARIGLADAAMYTMAAAGVMGLVGLVLAVLGRKTRAGIVGILVIVAAGVAGGQLYSQTMLRSDLPPINDVQTDWSRPVAFTEKALREREAHQAIRVRDDALVPDGEGSWSGMTYAAAQAKFYRDLKPLEVKQAPPEATLAAEEAAKRLGWDVMMVDPPGGALEAVYHSPWYDLVYDIAVRVTAEASGSRIDVRSTSRAPGADMGENANSVKQLIDEIALQLR